MNSKLNIYLRSIWFNRITLSGIIICLLSLTLQTVFVSEDQIVYYVLNGTFMCGSGLIGVTKIGFETYWAYHKTMLRIKKTDGKGSLEFYDAKEMYCGRVGQKIALQDAFKLGYITKKPSF